nr:RNA polymerase subunit sigma-70 [Clostridioides difficile]
MPGCRSPPFLSVKQADKKEMEETLWQKSIIFISEDKR